MPISLNTSRIIRLDDMNWLELLRKLNANFSFAAQRIHSSTNFVFATRTMLQ